MAESYNPYLFLAVFAVVAVLFAVGPLILARIWAIFFAPPKPGREKNAIYECGLESRGDAWVQFCLFDADNQEIPVSSMEFVHVR